MEDVINKPDYQRLSLAGATGVVEADIRGWPGLRLVAGPISCGVVPGLGGRILSLEFAGVELFFCQEERAGETHDFSETADLRAAKRTLGFGLWGGDKTWVAPQSLWHEGIPPLELDAAGYDCEFDGEALLLRSVLCRETGLQISRRVSLSDAGELTLEETLRNGSEKDVRRGVWNVTQCLRPFDVFLPVSPGELSPYEEEGESVAVHRSLVSPAEGWVMVPCDRPRQFKFGALARKGVMIAVRRGETNNLAHVRRFTADPGAVYAHDASIEVYNSPDHEYLELELHAPLVTLAPGESVSQTQRWQFFQTSPGISFPELLNLVPD